MYNYLILITMTRTLNFGIVFSGELSLSGDDDGVMSSEGEGHLELEGDGLGVLNMPRGRGRPRSMVAGRGTLPFRRMKKHGRGRSSLVLFFSNSYCD